MNRLDELGWRGVPFITACMNIVWLFVAAGLDADVPLRLIEDEGVRNGYRAQACFRRALTGMLDEAERVGRLEVLRRPRVREPFEALEALERMYRGGCAE